MTRHASSAPTHNKTLPPPVESVLCSIVLREVRVSQALLPRDPLLGFIVNSRPQKSSSSSDIFPAYLASKPSGPRPQIAEGDSGALVGVELKTPSSGPA